METFKVKSRKYKIKYKMGPDDLQHQMTLTRHMHTEPSIIQFAEEADKLGLCIQMKVDLEGVHFFLPLPPPGRQWRLKAANIEAHVPANQWYTRSQPTGLFTIYLDPVKKSEVTFTVIPV